MRVQVLITTLVVSLIFTAAGAGNMTAPLQELPGAQGPLYEAVLSEDFKVTGADIGVDMNDANADKPPPQRTFPSGTKELYVVVKLGRRPAAESFSVEVYNRNGTVEMGHGIAMQAEDLKTGEYSVGMDLNPKAGEFADGPHQARLKFDDKVVALVNWGIGQTGE